MIALVTGATGQAGRSLIEYLLSKDYKVYGMVRRTSNPSTERIKHLLDRIELITGDLTDQHSLISALEQSQPDQVYNLAAMSFVPTSWDQPILAGDVTGLGVTRLLSAIRTVNPKIRFLQTSSSEQFGLVREIPQKETTPFYPRSPYACAKTFAHYTTINMRESYGLFACTAICFNFEGVHRGTEFVTKKITEGANKIRRGEAKELLLGNLDAKRDWNYVGDTVRAMHMIMNHSVADDFVVASGECHSVREFCELAFGHYGMDYRDYVKIDPKLIRPAEVPLLQGDSTKIRETLGWKPEVNFKQLAEMMISTPD